MSSKNTLIALAAGAALGAVAGLLLAPASGRETRSKLKKKGEDLRDQLTDLMDQGKELMDETVGTVKGAVKDAAAHASSSVNSAADKAKSAYQQTKATTNTH